MSKDLPRRCGLILPNHKHQQDLLKQKYIDLTTTFARMKLKTGELEQHQQLLSKIEAEFEQAHCWDSEIELNFLDAKHRLSAAGCNFFNQQYTKITARDGKIHLLCNLYKKLQISYDLEEQKKSLLSGMRFTTSMAFLLSLSMFFMFDNLRFVKMFMTPESTDKFEFVVASLAAGWGLVLVCCWDSKVTSTVKVWPSLRPSVVLII